MTNRNPKIGMFEHHVYIERLSDGLRYAGNDDRTNKEIWDATGKSFPTWHGSVYLARIQPELYRIQDVK